MKEEKLVYGEKPVPRRKVSFGISDSLVHTFNPSDIVETVHLISEIPGDESRKAHFILSFAHDNDSPPPEIAPRQPSSSPKKASGKFKFESEDELCEAAPPPLPKLPDAIVVPPNQLKGMFRISEEESPEIADVVTVEYTIDESWSTCFTAEAEIFSDRIYNFFLTLEHDSELVQMIEKSLRQENDQEFGALDSDTYYAIRKPLTWHGMVWF